jgi:hypothetical protein
MLIWIPSPKYQHGNEQSAEGKEKMPNDRDLFRALRHFALSPLLLALSSLPLCR